jgi:hypothetical protein
LKLQHDPVDRRSLSHSVPRSGDCRAGAALQSAAVCHQFIQHHLQDCKQFIFALFIKLSLHWQETELRYDRQEDDIAAAPGARWNGHAAESARA